MKAIIGEVILIIGMVFCVLTLLFVSANMSDSEEKQSIREAICKIGSSIKGVLCDLFRLSDIEKVFPDKGNKCIFRAIYWFMLAYGAVYSASINCWIILPSIIFIWLMFKLFIEAGGLINEVIIEASHELGNKWFLVTIAQLIALFLFVEIGQVQYIKNIILKTIGIKVITWLFFFGVLFYCVRVQLATVKILISQILEGEYRISGKMALAMSSGLVVSQILLFILLVWFGMFSNSEAFITAQGQISLNMSSLLSGAVFVLVTYFNLGYSNLEPNNGIGVGITLIIALVGFLMFTFLIVAIVDSIKEKTKEVKQERTEAQTEDKEAEEVKQETTDAQIEDKEAKEVKQEPDEMQKEGKKVKEVKQEPTKMQTEDKGPKEKQPSRPHERGKADTKQHAKNKKRLQGRKKRK